MPLIIPANSAVSGGFNVDNSARFNKASADNLIRTFGTATNRRKWTLSMWTKRSSTAQAMLYSTSSASSYYQYQSGGQLELNDVPGSTFNYRLVTNALYIDLSAWYHIVIAFDSTQGTDSNRIKLYVNGEQPSLATATYPSQNFEPRVNNAEAQKFGSYDGSTDYSYDGYFSELTFIDGQQLDPTSFGEFDEDSGIWKPIKISGLTFGNNGFHLDFKDSSALGNDAAGSNNFTVNNLTAIDQSTDTCTNNFSTFNSAQKALANTSFSEGNLVASTNSSASTQVPFATTIPVSTGKWYAEFKMIAKSTSSGSIPYIGILGAANFVSELNNAYFIGGANLDGVGYGTSGVVYSNGSELDSSEATIANGDIVGIAADITNKKIYFSKNGTYINSQDPAAGSNGYTIPTTSQGFYIFAASLFGASGSWGANFGSPPYAISSGNQDADGFGNFEYAVPSGFFSLNTKNLAEYG